MNRLCKPRRAKMLGHLPKVVDLLALIRAKPRVGIRCLGKGSVLRRYEAGRIAAVHMGSRAAAHRRSEELEGANLPVAFMPQRA